MEKKDNNRPLVSVIMATYNEPVHFIAQSIKSILTQTYTNLELLIADDSTSADTISTIDKLAEADNRIRIIRSNERMGFVGALNKCMDLAQGELIARMDGDDVSLPERLSIQVDFAKKNPQMGIFGGDMNIIDENANVLSERTYPTSSSAIKRMFVFRSPFAHPTIMFRRSIIDNGFRYNPEYKRAEDIDFILRLFREGYKFSNTGKKLLNYRVVGDLQKKRNRDQWIYNHRARTKNFIWRKPLFSTLSYLISLAYQIVPDIIITKYYEKENHKMSN